LASEHVHLIGIGGTGMAALAGLLHESGCRVSGSDRRLYPPTSLLLERLGLDVRVGFDEANLDPAPDLVVVGNAVSRGNPEAELVLDRRLPFTSMPRLLAERFIAGRHSVVVAGTHGKTTTASMMAWVLERAGRRPGFLIGGIPRNFERPYALGSGQVFVVEGDEYDSAFFDKGPKFMHYRPDTAVLGPVEFDHADIYADLDQIKLAFARFVNIVPRRGLVVRQEGCETTREVTGGSSSRVVGCGLHAGAWRARSIVESHGRTRFEIVREGRPYAEASLALPGEHNVLNALSVAAACDDLGLSAAEIADGLSSFEGVSRRLECRGEAGGVTVLDDFAHHPTAIAATLRAVRERYPGRRVWAVLEPRSGSLRRNVFQDSLSRSFEDADRVVIAGVFRPESIPPAERLDPYALVETLLGLGARASYLARVEQIVERVSAEASPGDVVVVMSNGGFEGLHDRLLRALRERGEQR